jgi:hypothetical protein
MDLGEWYLEVNGRKVGPFTLDQIQGFLDDGEIRAYHQVTSAEVGGKWMSVEEMLESRSSSAPADFGEDLPPPPPPASSSDEYLLERAPTPAEPTQMNSTKVESTHPHAAYTAASGPSLAEMAAQYTPDSSFQAPPRPDLEMSSSASDPVADAVADPLAAVVEREADPATGLFDALQVIRERQSAAFQPPAVKVSPSRKALFKVPSKAKMDEVTREVTRQVTTKFTMIRDSIPLPEQVPPKLWVMAAVAGLILGGLTLGVFRLLKPKLHPSPGSITQVTGLNPEAPRHVLPPPPISAPRIVQPPPPINNRAVDNPPVDRPEINRDNNPPPQQPVEPAQPQQQQDPNNPYPQDGNNGGQIMGAPLDQQQQQPGQPPQQTLQQPPPQVPVDPNQPPPGYDSQGNPIQGYIPPAQSNMDPNQVPQPGQPGAPGQDAFQPGQNGQVIPPGQPNIQNQ